MEAVDRSLVGRLAFAPVTSTLGNSRDVKEAYPGDQAPRLTARVSLSVSGAGGVNPSLFCRNEVHHVQ